MDKYQLVIRVKFDAVDDIQARKFAEKLISVSSLCKIPGDSVDMKLQMLKKGSPPEGIRFKHGESKE